MSLAFRSPGFFGDLLLVLMLAGCGNSSGLVPVQGVLTLDGEPVDGAAVAFVPEAEGGRAAQAMTDEDGSFRLETTDRVGIKPGKYKVTVFKLAEGAAKTAARPQSALPEIYASKDKTPISVEIPPPGELHIELKSDE